MIPTPLLYRRSLFGVETSSDGVTVLFIIVVVEGNFH